MKLGCLVLCLAVGWPAGRALADGAFPGGLSVYLPVNAPQRIMMGTNFGLVISDDAGQTWRFVCELYITNSGADLVNYYKIAPDNAILAVTYVNLWRSADGGCSWKRATGSVDALSVTDAFIDPNDASFVLAIATNASGTGSGIYPSHDGGVTFGPALYTTPDRLVGIEFARSKRGVIYATQVHPATQAGGAYLLRSDDFGVNWTPQLLNVSAATEPRIAGVDPEDENKVYLRLLALGDPPGKDSIASTTDNGKTLNPLASLTTGTTFFTSFLRAKDGTLYAGTSSADLYVMPPGATTFTKRTGPRVGCLGQRLGDSRIYACADAFVDGYNLGYSDDNALTFQRLMKFTQIAGPLTCPAVNDACASQYIILMQTLGVYDGGLIPSPDAGNLGPPSKGSGCGSPGSAGAVALLLLIAFVLRRRGP